jgi:hypothetical protein
MGKQGAVGPTTAGHISPQSAIESVIVDDGVGFPFRVVSVTGPPILPGMSYYLGSNGIEFNVAITA